MAQRLKHLPAIWETRVRSLGQEDPLEKGMATHSSTLAWRTHGGRTLVGYSPWDRKESDMTERLHFHFQQSSWFSRQNKENEEFRNLGLWKICLLL